ncbi:MAG: hypothetical protein JW982_11505 [Spirochaetes bacterium]|nr:hypothetical protein [Spirochaetota bacterium]
MKTGISAGVIFVFIMVLLFQSCRTTGVKDYKNEAVNVNALQLLKESKFDEAFEVSGRRLDAVKNDSNALMINIISQYIVTVRNINTEMRYYNSLKWNDITSDLYATFSNADKNFREIENHLKILSKDKNFKFSFVPGELKIDWDGDGFISESEENMFSVETDDEGNAVSPHNPEFTFDHSDVLWAQSYMNFHLAFLNVISCFDYDDVIYLFKNSSSLDDMGTVTVKIRNKKDLVNAHGYFMKGFDLSEKTRLSVLSESDDDREWLPNPKQKSCPLPLKMNKELFDKWKMFLFYLKELASGKTMLSFQSFFDNSWHPVKMTGGLDIKNMFLNSNDIHFNLKSLEQKYLLSGRSGNFDPLMEELFGKFYIYDKPESPLLKKLMEMKKDVESGMDTYAYKMKFLLWIN